jgi:probable HAF family extracellular repeat protein
MHQRLAVVTILTLVFGACEQAMAPQELLPGPRFSTTGGGYTAIDLGHLGGDAYITRSLGLAINDNGQVVGWSRTPSGAVHAFFWDGTMHDLGTLGGAASQAVAVNTAARVPRTAPSCGTVPCTTSAHWAVPLATRWPSPTPDR